MDYEFEKIVDLTREIFENCTSVSKYTVRKIGGKYTIKILNPKKEIIFGMKGNYNNVKYVSKLIINEQKNNSVIQNN